MFFGKAKRKDRLSGIVRLLLIAVPCTKKVLKNAYRFNYRMNELMKSNAIFFSLYIVI